MPYSFLHPDLHSIANITKTRLEQKYNIRITDFEKGFESNVEYSPTFFGKTKSHYILCEVSTRPFPIQIKSIYADIQNQNIPVKLIVAYPDEIEISARDLQTDITNAKTFGIGLISVRSNGTLTIHSDPISIPLFLPQASIGLNTFHSKFKHLIEDAYSVYSNGNPKHGVQELGQIIEQVIRNLAIQARRLGHYTNGVDPNLPGSPFATIIDNLIANGIINVAFLNRARAYAEDRNGASHRINSLKKSLIQEQKYKLDFQTGLRILSEIPNIFSNGKNNFRYKIVII